MTQQQLFTYIRKTVDGAMNGSTPQGRRIATFLENQAARLRVVHGRGRGFTLYETTKENEMPRSVEVDDAEGEAFAARHGL